MIKHMEPGRYRTRDGQLAIVSLSAWALLNCWAGRIGDNVEVWDKNGRYYGDSLDSPLDLVARLPDAAPVDDRIERALHVLREASRYDTTEGYSVTDATVIDGAMQILEGEIDD